MYIKSGPLSGQCKEILKLKLNKSNTTQEHIYKYRLKKEEK